jgi:hypothetical protein
MHSFCMCECESSRETNRIFVNSCLTRCWQQNRQTHAQVTLGAMGKNELSWRIPISLSLETGNESCWREQFCCFYISAMNYVKVRRCAGGVRRADGRRALEKTTPSQEGLEFPYWKSNRAPPIQRLRNSILSPREKAPSACRLERKGEQRKAGPLLKVTSKQCF